MVAVARVVVVAVGRPAVPGIIVPATATIHPVGAIDRPLPLKEHRIEDVFPEVKGVPYF